ncbi:LysE/ArgO family amino acid transporter [Paraglaciecola sp. L3A3]|uniref:LysE/ArgO family amino acid transporter n=1 Tax=Paraglaciecola sp. L3A3 TaxID=2686358 RepID=UPI00131E6495|nr:LysE/ArgO family amino acid transporter [Paraglaciecola sp. L3A3]
MLFAVVQGFFLGLSMILPLGAQNSHVLNHGIKQNHHLLVASICIVCDVLLIALGVFGAAKLLANSPQLVWLISWAGIIFLLSYAALSFRSAWRNSYHKSEINGYGTKKTTVITTTLAITLLNPHVYLDTVVILGSVGEQFVGHDKVAFAVGTMLASIIWFYSLAGAAAKLSPWLNRPKVQRIIDTIVALIMCMIAYMLFSSL